LAGIDGAAAVIVTRNAGHDIGERELYVSLDGAPNAILRYGDTVTLPVTPGHHRLRVHNTWKRRVAEFDVAPGEQVRFRAVNAPGKGYTFMAVFFGFALMNTELERDDAPPAL
jgi:hypothetical protein